MVSYNIALLKRQEKGLPAEGGFPQRAAYTLSAPRTPHSAGSPLISLAATSQLLRRVLLLYLSYAWTCMWLGPGSSHLSSYLSLDILFHSSGIKYQLSSAYLQSRALLLHTMVQTTTNLTSPPRYLTGIRNMSCPEVNSYFIASLQSLTSFISQGLHTSASSTWGDLPSAIDMAGFSSFRSVIPSPRGLF